MPRTPHASPQTLRLFRALLDDPATWRYGYDLSRETGLASGTLYPILMRLEQQQLLEAGWEPSDQPGKPPRHTYRLTGEGVSLAGDRLAATEATAKATAKAAEAGARVARPGAANAAKQARLA